MEDRERVYLNVAKGVAVFLMLWGHFIQYCALDSFDFFENIVFKVIYSFHMPLFMLISGYLFFFSFEKRDLKTLLIHRTQNLLQPIVFASILNSILIKIPDLSFNLLDGALFDQMQSLWFLWCVLSSSLAVGIGCKITKNAWLQMVYCVLGILLVGMFPNIHMHLFMYPYFVIGFVYGKYKDAIPEQMKKLRYLSLLAFPVMLLFYQKKHYIYITPIYDSRMPAMEWITISAFRWAIGLVGCLFVLCIISLLSRLIKEESMKAMKWIPCLGENSLAIYCLSVSLLSSYLPRIYNWIVQMLGYNLFAENMMLYNLVFTPLLTVLYALILLGAIRVLKKCNLYHLIFRR